MPRFITDQYTGVKRVLNLRPRPASLRMRARRTLAAIPEKDWIEFSYEGMPVKVKDQGQFGACNGHAAATSHEIARWIAGLTHVDLSAWFVYAILCNGRDVGSSIAEALDLLRREGTCPESDVPWGTINPGRLSQQAHQHANRFRIEIGGSLRSFAEMMSATQQGRPGNFSICADSFGRLDASGCPGYSRGPCNHAVTYGLGAKKDRDGKWMILCQNSWTPQWGLNGYFYIKDYHVDGAPYFDAYEVVAVENDPEDPDAPPAVLDGTGLPASRRVAAL